MKIYFLIILAISVIFCISIASGFNVTTSNYTVDSYHQGLAGANGSTNNYTFTSTTTYEQPGNYKIYTPHYAANVGWLNVTNTTVPYVCGNGMLEPGEACDNGTDNGACPKACSDTCGTNSCGSSDNSPAGGDSSAAPLTPQTPVIPDPSLTKLYLTISAGLTNITVDSTDIPLSAIYITLTNSSTNVQFIITRADSNKIVYSASKVYRYLKIDHANLDDKMIAGAKIKFRIEKSWMINNTKGNDDVLLSRYSEQTSAWQPLTTKNISEDATYVYFMAESTGLSLYVISSKTPAVKPAAAAPATQNTNTPAPNTASGGNLVMKQTSTLNDSTLTDVPPETKSNSIILPVLIGLCLIGAVLLVVFNKLRQANANTTEKKTDAENDEVETFTEVEQKLEEWILKKEELGFMRETMRNFLIEKGYDIRDVEQAIAYAGKKKKK